MPPFPSLRAISIVASLAIATTLLTLPAVAKNRKTPATPTPAPAATPAAEPASLRLWKQDFVSRRPYRIEVIPVGSNVTPLDYHPAKQGATLTEYAEVASGAVTVKVTPQDADDAKSVTLPLHLEAGEFATLVLRELKGVPDLQVVNDAPAGDDEADAELSVRNFAPGLTHIHVQSGDDFAVYLRAPEGCVYLRGLERKLMQLDTTATAQDGKKSKWTTEVNFGKVRKATLLILTDSYGRIRPRIVVDGQPALTATQASALPPTSQPQALTP